MMPHERVVLTGLGPLTPIGGGIETYWRALLDGVGGIGPITLFDTSEHHSKIAGEIKHFDLRDYITPKTRISRLSRQTQLALAAAIMATDDSGILHAVNGNGHRIPVIMGVSNSAMEMIEHGIARMVSRGPPRVPSYIVSGAQPQQAASVISDEMSFPTEAHTISSACAAGVDAIATAFRRVASGKADVAIAGGADAPITSFTFACFERAGLQSTWSGEPERASRPFDRNCETGVISEGAGVVVLENLDHARARGAKIYAEIVGYGTQADIDSKHPDSGLEFSMRDALANAGVRPQDIDYINAHGPGHPAIDLAETQMIKKVFGEHALRIPVSSIKGAVGNPLAAAGPMQLIACACALRDQMIPPTLNLDNPAPGCDLDYVTKTPRLGHFKLALMNIHGLGGGNSSLILRRAEA
ncbi:MAG: beta-ketoacyl-[acyl-carrier-protein] synthase family protein [Verrucomicrobia bacterium]|nr:beta-ketoacyl-[acyl-carrier-protein] synthase family protein [Verrucomicrobiota bacterium]